MDVRTFPAIRRKKAPALHFCFIGGGKIGTAAEQVREICSKLVEHIPAGCAGSFGAFRCKQGLIRCERFREILAVPGRPFCIKRRIGCPVGFQHGVVCGIPCCTVLRKRFIMRVDFSGNFELIGSPTHRFFHCNDVFFPKRFAMRACLALLCSALRDICVHNDKRRLFGFSFCCFKRYADRTHIFAIIYRDYLPAIGGKAGSDIFCKRCVRIAFNGNAVAVIKRDQFSQLLRARKARGFGGSALHHAAIAHKHKGIVVYNREAFPVKFGCHVRFGHRHADRHGKALPQRACCGFYAHRVAIFGVAGGAAANLAEIFQIFHGKSIAVQVQQCIFQHGGMPCGKHKTISPGPGRVLGIVFHLLPKGVSHRCCANGHARMAAVGFLNRVCREHADCGNSLPFNRLHKISSKPFAFTKN